MATSSDSKPTSLEIVKRIRTIPDFLQSVNIKYVKLGYRAFYSRAIYIFFIPLLVFIAVEVSRLRHTNLAELWQQLKFNLVSVIAFSAALVIGATIYFISRPLPVYLVDFACATGDAKLKCSNSAFLGYSKKTGAFSEGSFEFQRRICERSGLGDETYLPPMVFNSPPNPCMYEARCEAEAIIFDALNTLFLSTSISPRDIDILVVNSSLFNPTPSLTTMIVNKYKMRGNLKSFNLGGMGCSAGVISIDLAKRLLQVHKNSYAIVVSTENITLNWYWGNEKSMLLSNCIFRMGGAAILLSNKRKEKAIAKYELVHSVRTHKGADDKPFTCVYQEEDPTGRMGVALSKDLMAVAGDALKTNITTLGPLVLPITEQLLFFVSLVMRRLSYPKMKPYIPDFKRAFEHFCIHAGGRGVLDEIEKNLQLTEWHMEPSRMTLYRFGNTSSSSLWYELAYTEAKGRINKGDRVWQIAFGSGFKCNSAVWRALQSVPPSLSNNPWSPSIDKFPVAVPTCRNLC
ncbi:hypothetical protein L7F22_059590 [Adiantum nelumboides]|nr:hypothetical protein [Adiantum nelumboides]